MEGLIIRIVKLSEVLRRPSFRPDPSHHNPRHKIWECREADKSKRRGA